MKTVRIFVSSPGDVIEERDKARRIIEQLARHYAGALELLTILWEDLPLQADCSFQQGIDVVLSEDHGIDIAVFVLWSRLGSPLGGAFRRPDGTPYRSGTEREFELMLEARRQSGHGRPALLAYTREDAQGFLERLKGKNTQEIEQALAQRKLAEQFIRESFQDAEGHNIRAYHSFTEPVSFASRLRVHLRALIDELLGEASAHTLWTQPPYQGLQAFDLEHAAIFRGREAEICELGLLLRQRAERDHCAFVVVVGGSGSGKSSLVRAGLAASLLHENIDDAVRAWRVAMMLPSADGGDALAALARALTAAQALPEILDNGTTAEALAAALHTAPAQALELCLKPALAVASRNAAGPVRLLLVVDQLEELYTDTRMAPGAAPVFLEAVETLARNGSISVVATLRSDFFPRIQKEESFLRLKGSDGQFELLAPQVAALRRIIVEPARIAGLSFETDAASGTRLEDQLLSDAAELADALPLVQFALRELYELRDGVQLSFAAYAGMQGVKGAIGARAELVFSRQDPAARAAFEAVFRQLLCFDSTAVTRRRARRADVNRNAAETTLVAALIDERLLAADREGLEATVTLTHEILLHSWPRLAQFVEANRDALRTRARLEQAHARWLEQSRDSSLLLHPGRPLAEAESLLAEMPDIVPQALREYVADSQAHWQAVARRQRRQRQLVAAGLGALALVALGGALLAWLQQRETDAAQHRATAFHQVHEGDAYLQREDWNTALRMYREAYLAAPDFVTRSALLHGLRAIDPRLWQGIDTAQSAVVALDFDAAGTLLAAARDGALSRIEDASGRRVAPALPRAGDPIADEVKALRSTGGGAALVVRRDGRVESISANGDGSAQALGRMPCAGTCEVAAAAIAPAGDRLAASDAEQAIAHVLQLPQGAWSTLAPIDGSRITALAFAPDAGRLVYGTERGSVAIENPGDAPHTRLRDADGQRITALAWGAAAGQGIVAGDTSGRVTVFAADGVAGASVPTQQRPVTAFAWNPDQQLLAVASGKRVSVYPLAADEGRMQPAPVTLDGHARTVLSLAWSRDGTRLASGADDQRVLLWTPGQTHGPFRSWAGIGEPLHALAVSPDGALVAAGGTRGSICVWSAPQRRLLSCLSEEQDQEVNALAWHPREPRLASGDHAGRVRLWRWQQDRLVRDAPPDTAAAEHRGDVWTLRWFPDAQVLVSAGHDGRIAFRQPAQNVVTTFARLPDYALGLDISRDQTRLAAASTDGIIRLWSIAGYQPGATAQNPPLTSSAGDAHRSSVGGLAFSPDGERLASASNDGTIRLWEPGSGRILAASPDTGGTLEAVRFDAAGKVLASVGSDGQLRVWDAASLEPLLALAVSTYPALNIDWLAASGEFVWSSTDGRVYSLAWDEAQWLARLEQLLGPPAR